MARLGGVWRLALIWSMAGLFLFVLLVPATQRFFALDPPDELVWLAALGSPRRAIGQRALDPEDRQ